MTKFKIGDRVRNNDGYEYTIREIAGSYGRENVGDMSHSWLLDNLKLVTDSKPKFKVGDSVKITSNNTLHIEKRQGDHAFIFGTQSDDQAHKWWKVRFSDGYEVGVYEEGLELITINEPSNSSENKVGKIMSNVIDFVKKSLLSKEEKLLRKYGFKDSYGNYTSTADEFSQLEANKTNEVKMIEVCEKMEAEEKANK